MIVFDRREAARFRAAVRRCVAGRPRGLAPPVVLQRDESGMTLSATLEDVTLALQLPRRAGSPRQLVIPFTTLAAIESQGGGEVILEEGAPDHVLCRWLDHDEPRELDSPLISPDEQPVQLPPRGKLSPADPPLLTALHACGQTASRQDHRRYALTRLQLRGQAGQVVGTDGQQLLVWGGFAFPFPEDVLIPAVPFFGGRELADEEDVRLARTTKHVVVAVGPWTIWLGIDATACFPDVTTVMPRSSDLTTLVFDDRDAKALLQDVQQGLRSADEVESVVLNLGPRPALRWPENAPGRRGPLNLIRSSVSGPARAVTLNPKFLVRALSLGFRQVQGSSASSAILFRDRNRSYLVAGFGPAAERAGPSHDGQPLPDSQLTRPSPHEGDELMNPERNGRPSDEPAPNEGVLDPLTEAEALRAALVEAARRVGRLLLSLKQMQKQRRALQTAWTSLRNLQIGPKEAP